LKNTKAVAFSVVIQSDGKIVAAGRKGNVFNDDEFVLVRYNINGSPIQRLMTMEL
jgi:hypothetical protein